MWVLNVSKELEVVSFLWYDITLRCHNDARSSNVPTRIETAIVITRWIPHWFVAMTTVMMTTSFAALPSKWMSYQIPKIPPFPPNFKLSFSKSAPNWNCVRCTFHHHLRKMVECPKEMSHCAQLKPDWRQIWNALTFNLLLLLKTMLILPTTEYQIIEISSWIQLKWTGHQIWRVKSKKNSSQTFAV